MVAWTETLAVETQRRLVGGWIQGGPAKPMVDADRRLAERVRRGDRRALETIYRRHRAKLFGFLVKTLGDRATAEDVFQEVWTKVIQVAQSFEPERGNLRSWIFRIAANAAVDRQRRDAVRRTEALDAPSEDGTMRTIDLMPSEEPDPERRAAATESGEALDLAMASLKDNQRAAVLLRHQQGMSYAEISQALQVAEGTAKTLVHRGVRILRAKLASSGLSRGDRV